MIGLVFLVGIVMGICIGVAVMCLMRAAHDADEAMSEHVKRNYTVRKPE